jgi:hypothetical protein
MNPRALRRSGGPGHEFPLGRMIPGSARGDWSDDQYRGSDVSICWAH